MVALVGESGGGKSELERGLESLGYNKIISYTTRPPRSYEENGVQYHFISMEQFRNLMSQDFFAEINKYNDNYYGAAKEDCVENKVIVVEINGLLNLKNNLSGKLISFYIKTDEQVRVDRMKQRGDTEQQITERLKVDERAFKDIDKQVDYIVDGNQTKEKVLQDVVDILRNMEGDSCIQK